MKRGLVGLALVFLTAAAASPDKIGLQITLSTAGDHLRAHFHTERPVTEIVLDDRESAENEALVAPMRQRQWRPVGSGWHPITGRLARRDGALFQDADVDLFPDDRPIGWIDPLLFSAGGGFVLHGRYLLADMGRFLTTVTFQPGEGEILDFGGSASPSPRHDFTREMYLGPASSLTSVSGLRVLAAAAVPAWLRGRLVNGMVRSMAFYEDMLGQAAPSTPTLILAQLRDPSEETHTSLIGQAETGGVLTFRFFEALPDGEAGHMIVDHLAAHEAFHLWNGSAARLADQEKALWLPEGGAEYAALLAQRAAGSLDDARWYHEFNVRLSSCRRLLGARGLAQIGGAEAHRLAYPCGTIIQWIGDMAILHASQQQRGIFDLWRDLLRKAKNQGNVYRVEDFRAFLAQTDASSVTAVDLLLDPDKGDRWTKLRKQMEAYGVRTGPALRNEEAVRSDLFRHLVDADCINPGLWRSSDGPVGVRLLFSHPACQHLGQSDTVLTVEGHSPVLDIYAAYYAALYKCALGRAVDITLEGGRSLGLVCALPLPPLAHMPPDFVVLGMP